MLPFLFGCLDLCTPLDSGSTWSHWLQIQLPHHLHFVIQIPGHLLLWGTPAISLDMLLRSRARAAFCHLFMTSRYLPRGNSYKDLGVLLISTGTIFRIYSSVAAPSHIPMSSETTFRWNLQAEEVFSSLKQKTSSVVVLVIPNPNLQFIMRSMLWFSAVGEVLYQHSPGDKWVNLIVFFWWKLPQLRLTMMLATESFSLWNCFWKNGGTSCRGLYCTLLLSWLY